MLTFGIAPTDASAIIGSANKGEKIMLKHTTIAKSVLAFLTVVFLVEFAMPFLTPAQATEPKEIRKNSRIFVPPANEPKFEPPIEILKPQTQAASIEEDQQESIEHEVYIEPDEYIEPAYDEVYYEEPYYESTYYEPYYDSYYYESTGLNPQSGVNYYDGRKETYYSSNVLYHKDTGNWSVDNEGFYRTDEGYYVVAASDMAQGTVFEGSQGTCIVLEAW